MKRLGHNVRVFERNPAPVLHNQGAGELAEADTQAFFDNFEATNRPITITSNLIHRLDLEGEQRREVGIIQRMTSWDLRYYLLRANFDGVASGYCRVSEATKGEGKGIYEYGHLVKNVRDVGKQVEIVHEGRDGKSTTTFADLVIGADGASSTLRTLLMSDVKRDYAGYVAWRGTVPGQEVSLSAKETLVEKFTFYESPGTQVLEYVIPGENGSLEFGEILINWVWYCNYPGESSELKELLMDSDGKTHRITLPVGKMKKEVLERKKEYAKKNLSPQLAEIVCCTQQPFVQAITDVLAPRNSFYGGKKFSW